jgi:hypothetical protein
MKEDIKMCIHAIRGALGALENFAYYLEDNNASEEAREVAGAAKQSIQKIVSAVEKLEVAAKLQT